MPGMTAAMTVLPVLGVPVESKALKGMDSLLSIVQMPGGVPVGTLAIGKAGAINAALFAAAMLAAGEWRATATSSDPGTIGFHLSALYSPVGWLSWVEIARAWENFFLAEFGNNGALVAGDAVTTEVVFTDTRSLRGFTVLALDIAWRRIGQHAPGSNEPLRAAVEACYGQAIGTEVVPVTADLRARYAAFAQAVAWAGVNGG